MTEIQIASRRLIQFVELVGEYVKNPRKMMLLANSCADLTNEIVREAVDEALDTASHPFQNIIRDQEEELQAVYTRLRNMEDKRDVLHEVLVNVCRTTPAIVEHVNASRKINAIKELRRITNASLKASKDAVEDPRVRDAAMFLVVGFGHVGTD